MRRRMFGLGSLAVVAVASFSVFAISACAEGGGELAPSPRVDDEGAPPPPSRASESIPDVVWLKYGVQRAGSDPSWGSVLTDIAQHLPDSYGSQYWDSDLMTAGHETTHGINSDVRNNHNDTGKKANGLYVTGDKAALIVEPSFRKSQVAEFIPSSLHGSRYDLYITGQTDWDDTPTYVFDEWDAYTNGAAVCLDLTHRGIYKGGWTDCVYGPLEFTVYSIAVAMAAEKYDPAYFASYPQLKAFVAWNARRAMDLFREGQGLDSFKYAEQDAYYAKIATSPDAEALRAFCRKTFGDTWTKEVLFGEKGGGGDDAGPPSVDAGPADTGVADTGTLPVVDAGPTTRDEDGDGIVDDVDLCSHTPHGAPVWPSGEWIGCAAGQHRDGGGGLDSDGWRPRQQGSLQSHRARRARVEVRRMARMRGRPAPRRMTRPCCSSPPPCDAA